ncbi:hypothetical protein BDV59DRAFT_198476 [Aspergillus ambiguus]|uniref:uncharacterized protein n=1 Tax=Aspergillus ambiguus TaxID=176160 RepID=UPI003CCCCB3A
MKFSLISLLSLATLAMAQREVAGYDSLSLGAFKASPFKGLNYSDNWSVGQSKVQVSNVKWRSPKVLFSGPQEVGRLFGTMNREDINLRFDTESVYASCSGPKKNGKKTTVPCTVMVEGYKRNTAGIDASPVIIKYTDTTRMQKVDLGNLSNINKIKFTVTKAGKNDELTDGVTLVLDSFIYSLDEKE